MDLTLKLAKINGSHRETCKDITTGLTMELAKMNGSHYETC